jgi:hypothetical protein
VPQYRIIKPNDPSAFDEANGPLAFDEANGPSNFQFNSFKMNKKSQIKTPTPKF